MAPVATLETKKETTNGTTKSHTPEKVFNPFYSPPATDENDNSYQFAQYKPHFPDVKWEPLGEVKVVERGLFADPEKKALLAAATKVQHLTPAIGTEISGIDLRQLSPAQKDELALLVAERGVVCKFPLAFVTITSLDFYELVFRDQDISIRELLEFHRHYGPLHKHATTGIPREPGLEEVHVVYNDASRRPDPSAFSKIELWHSDVTYEIQPPSTTSLKVIEGPPYGGDTLWSSGYALYSSFSPHFQKYLESLYAVHSAVAQADGAREAGHPVRREPVETIHPVVRVHPATGWKSVYVNPGELHVPQKALYSHTGLTAFLPIGFVRRIVGVPKAESDAILNLLFHQISENPDFQVRFHWERNSIAIWDNRVTTHSATFDFFPHTRHALRATPHGERPISVAEYEKSGKVAKDRQLDIWKQQGIAAPDTSNQGAGSKPRGYND
ncbi:TauD-domain-containing protein [Irpex rosettiformis]|uniref:TauD-domain-containing protein n=1 Tax=Irpex rosettiformis TaxID=378272 RepID=A0ACB8UA55_9APHY|nr:TauD-domain-containing protein [Irpex rosettiformis]